MKYTLATLIVLSMTACFDSKEDTAEEDNNNSSSFEPNEGTWLLSEPEFETDTCGFGGGNDTASAGDPEVMSLTKNSDATWMISIGAAPDTGDSQPMDFTCTLSGQDFSCEDLTMSEEMMEGATMNQSIQFSGTFASTTELTANINMNVSCDGASCGDLAAWGLNFPCEMAGSATATFSE